MRRREREKEKEKEREREKAGRLTQARPHCVA
jgi:hypothetical protein